LNCLSYFADFESPTHHPAWIVRDEENEVRKSLVAMEEEIGGGGEKDDALNGDLVKMQRIYHQIAVEFLAHQVNITRSQSTLNLLCEEGRRRP
jgi:hypothetical protein